MLVLNSLNNRKLNIPQRRQAWQTSGIDVLNSTVRRRLQSVGLGGHVAAKKPSVNCPTPTEDASVYY